MSTEIGQQTSFPWPPNPAKDAAIASLKTAEPWVVNFPRKTRLPRGYARLALKRSRLETTTIATT